MTAELRDIKDTGPNPATIAHCERLLKWAKEGKLRSLFAVTGWDDDSMVHGWTMDKRNGIRRMLGGIEIAKFDFMTDIAAADKDLRLSQVLEGNP